METKLASVDDPLTAAAAAGLGGDARAAHSSPVSQGKTTTSRGPARQPPVARFDGFADRNLRVWRAGVRERGGWHGLAFTSANISRGRSP
ncbi:MAG: hypothetical protein L0H64_22850 [Pseudonocardia sp.]|nr:hypothetical protein [Pseudonocardia sp.]